MLRHLEGLRAAGGACLSELLQHTVRLVHRRSVILFFPDLLEPSEDVALAFKQPRFNGHEVIIFQFLYRAALQFPFSAPKHFHAPHTTPPPPPTPHTAP